MFSSLMMVDFRLRRERLSRVLLTAGESLSGDDDKTNFVDLVFRFGDCPSPAGRATMLPQIGVSAGMGLLLSGVIDNVVFSEEFSSGF
jgi:hypothetical protein